MEPKEGYRGSAAPSASTTSAPEVLEPIGREFGIAHGVLYVLVAEVGFTVTVIEPNPPPPRASPQALPGSSS
jgi:hypothetical protein